MIIRCPSCKYLSDNLYNMKRHMIVKHKNENINNQNINNDNQNINNDNQNINMDNQNINMNNQNINMNDDLNDIDSNKIKCSKCSKYLSNQQNVKRHYKICKGVSNKLECYKCHNIFSSPQSKSVHMKKCTGPPPSIPSIQNISNITNINDHSQNANVINNNNNNIMNNNTVIYNNENIIFNDSHITKTHMKNMFNGKNIKAIEAIIEYCYKLLEKIENLCVEKKHITNSYCKVHVGNGVWEQRPDIPVIDRFSQDVAISANDKLYIYPNIGEEKLRKEIAELASYPEQVHTNAINLRREMKSVIINKSNNKNS